MLQALGGISTVSMPTSAPRARCRARSSPLRLWSRLRKSRSRHAVGRACRGLVAPVGGTASRGDAVGEEAGGSRPWRPGPGAPAAHRRLPADADRRQTRRRQALPVQCCAQGDVPDLARRSRRRSSRRASFQRSRAEGFLVVRPEARARQPSAAGSTKPRRRPCGITVPSPTNCAAAGGLRGKRTTRAGDHPRTHTSSSHPMPQTTGRTAPDTARRCVSAGRGLAMERRPQSMREPIPPVVLDTTRNSMEAESSCKQSAGGSCSEIDLGTSSPVIDWGRRLQLPAPRRHLTERRAWSGAGFVPVVLRHGMGSMKVWGPRMVAGPCCSVYRQAARPAAQFVGDRHRDSARPSPWLRASAAEWLTRHALLVVLQGIPPLRSLNEARRDDLRRSVWRSV